MRISIIKLTVAAFCAAVMVAAPVAVVAGGASVSAAVDPVKQLQEGANSTGGKQTSLQTFITRIVNMLLYILGAVAVVMLILGGFRYVTSNGDSSSISAAKNTILYAVIGIVVAVSAYAIVNFIVRSL